VNHVARHNATNLMAGSGAQQTRRPVAEETVEVVRNHEGGTGVGAGTLDPKASELLRQSASPEWTQQEHGEGEKWARPREEEPVGIRPGCDMVPAKSRAL